MDAFAGEVKNRSDLTIVSLDWGFQEPLLFLTQGPTLVEPFWFRQTELLPGTPGTTNCVYLIHPPTYRLFSWERDYLDRHSWPPTIWSAGPTLTEPEVSRSMSSAPGLAAAEEATGT